MLNLRVNTPKEWLDIVYSDFNRFLADHASCERKASSTNMMFVVKYPDKTKLIEPITKMALEELEHFYQVYQIMEKRNIPLMRDEKDLYVNKLLEHIRAKSDERLLDRLLISGIIEARGCERLGMVAESIEDKELKSFYQELTRCEARHHSQFLQLSKIYFTEKEISNRLNFLLDREAEAISSVPLRPILH